MSYRRRDSRKPDELRNIKIIRNYLRDPEGSVLIEMGNTKVICSASVEYKLPHFLREEGKNQGWITAEYDMLPRSAKKRIIRDRYQGIIKGRSQEIQRLIGRSLRAITDLTLFPDRTIYLDCDVIQADGGTRTAAINGCFIALYDAFTKMKKEKKIQEFPLNKFLGAVSVGIVDGNALLDLNFNEDLIAEVDMNIVKDEDGNYIEIQGASEHRAFSDSQLMEMLKLADDGIKYIIGILKQLVFEELV